MNAIDEKFIFDVVQTLLISAIGIFNWLNNRHRVTNAAISRLEDNIDTRLDDHAVRLARVEQDLKNAPSHSDLAEIYREMRNMTGVLSTMNAALAAQSSTLSALKEQVARMDSFWRTRESTIEVKK
ncbi:MAG: hypothetical protein Q7U38_14165 [Methylobacter sp.]|nr:hypothetical protein [Methylobacter sp.]MDP2169643.1 hypothetical protein [Rhodocyclaceae bacterium]MDP2429045.1 hypothetical protein [Methylobacter sp.]MDP3056546.1 hypothetical protein [Methylobacter sp.]MDP3362035.1 hypothetical protein [Methylobacter sp.]